MLEIRNVFVEINFFGIIVFMLSICFFDIICRVVVVIGRIVLGYLFLFKYKFLEGFFLWGYGMVCFVIYRLENVVE